MAAIEEIVEVRLDAETARLLLLNWVMKLGQDAGYGFTGWGHSGSQYSIRVGDGLEVKATPIDDPPLLAFTASDDSVQSGIEELVALAAERVASQDFGSHVWYSTELRTEAVEVLSPFGINQLLQVLSDQTRIEGWRRLGRPILLDFREELQQEEREAKLFAPGAVVGTHIAVPGPCPGPFTNGLAHNLLEIVGAICTFALGRPVVLPMTVFPADEDEVEDLDSRRTDREIRTLARKGTSLDIFGELVTLGGPDSHQRARAALLTFDAAMRQSHPQVASLLFLVAVESLTNPLTSWKRERLTKRFVVFFDELMPDDIDSIIGHANFEEAFDIRRGERTARALRRDFLSRLYGLRSWPLHEGLDVSYHGMSAGPDVLAGSRRALLSEFAQLAIIRFLEAPRVSLVGHPSFEPDD